MKVYRTNKGPFETRPHYKLTEIDHICSSALRTVNLLPDDPEPIRIERFVEKYFKISPNYKPLPPGVLGYTAFDLTGVAEIVITTALDEEGGRVSERRVRTTLAHEAGHGLLHMYMFILNGTSRSHFKDGDRRPEILCRDVQGTSGDSHYDGRWWEFQANRAIGGLLMPRGLVVKAAAQFVERGVGFGLPVLREDQRKRAALELAEIFDVNPIVARIRLEAIFPLGEKAQLSV